MFAKYLPHTSADETWQIYSMGAGYATVPPGTHYPPRADMHPPEYVGKGKFPVLGRTLHEYQIVYITAGKGVFRTEGGMHVEVNPGTVFLLFPRVWHTYAPVLETGWTEYWVGFNGTYPEALQKAGFFSPQSPVYNSGLDVSLLQDYQQIFALAEHEPPGFQLRLGAIVIEMLAKLISGTKISQQHNGAEEIVQKAKFIMEENIYGSLNMEAVSRQLDMPYPNFAAIFHEYTGLNPYHYFLEMKINHAKTMLADVRTTVKEVAYTLNFENEFYFSRLFKKKTGLSPSQWKKSLAAAESSGQYGHGWASEEADDDTEREIGSLP